MDGVGALVLSDGDAPVIENGGNGRFCARSRRQVAVVLGLLKVEKFVVCRQREALAPAAAGRAPFRDITAGGLLLTAAGVCRDDDNGVRDDGGGKGLPLEGRVGDRQGKPLADLPLPLAPPGRRDGAGDVEPPPV